MRKIRAWGIFSLMLAALSVQSASGDDQYTFIVKKQEDKRVNRWSLNDWLDTRDRMRLMDLWLAIHSPSPYEFFIGGDLRAGENLPTASKLDYRLQASAYASIFGLGIERESGFRRTNLLFFLRIFGYHNQATNVTLTVGLRNQEIPETFRSGIAGISGTLYLRKPFGFEAHYRRLFAGTPLPSGYTFAGNQVEANAFLDFQSLRIYGGYLSQIDDYQTCTGYHLGTRFYF